ncbi:hypothetical protein QGP82_23605 [Leptothoe sp. LEGE 181152]|nr:hypothetical protein [Leptothoe sp. LEGE 181152]
MPQSLSSWCKDNGLAKGTVHSKAKELKIDTSHGLSDEAIDELSKVFHLVQTEEDLPGQGVTIHTGNHRGELSLPQMPGSLDLSDNRGHAPLNTVSDDDIDAFLSVCDACVEGMRADYQNQVAITHKKKQQLSRVEQKVEEVKEENMRYRMRSEFISLHNDELDRKIHEGMSELSQGKSVIGGNGGRSQ